MLVPPPLPLCLFSFVFLCVGFFFFSLFVAQSAAFKTLRDRMTTACSLNQNLAALPSSSTATSSSASAVTSTARGERVQTAQSALRRGAKVRPSPQKRLASAAKRLLCIVHIFPTILRALVVTIFTFFFLAFYALVGTRPPGTSLEKRGRILTRKNTKGAGCSNSTWIYYLGICWVGRGGGVHLLK